MQPTRTCSLPDCDRPHRARGYCNSHYLRLHRYGDPNGQSAPALTLEERFWAHVTGGDFIECWLWTGPTNDAGYGRFFTPEREYAAHRWAYQHIVAPIPEGLELDHLCFTPPCINPWHLDPVTSLVNKQRTQKALATHCIHGHRYTEATTKIHPTRGTRSCRTCKNEQRPRETPSWSACEVLW